VDDYGLDGDFPARVADCLPFSVAACVGSFLVMVVLSSVLREGVLRLTEEVGNNIGCDSRLDT